ncbi:DUF2088 domain-containing protein [Alkalibacter sp. M17DMB]|nr:lactate racemase domain-containing protein [Alkalibacter mobilis]MBF7096629.1 DUF2088 domain-containing protein [Alkalibacter mobilis]
MFKVKQIFERPFLADEEIKSRITDGLLKENITGGIKPGMKIAITAGSRGVANIALVTKTIVEAVKSKGAEPFVIPTMGSHGGATASGQKSVLESYGLTEEYLECKIKSSMEVVKIGVNEEGMDVLIDKFASEADGIIVCNRIKPHTCFRGPYESGLMKMMTIGLGKQAGAEVCHEAGFKHMAKYIPMFGKVILENTPIICGIALMENAFDETCKIEVLDPQEIEKREPELLEEAKSMMPKILFEECDVLVCDKIGKNYSGGGMDPNITGTFVTPYASGGLKSQKVAVLDLSDESHGNGNGIGSSHATTRRFFDKMDFEMTYPNAITSTVVDNVRIPMVMKNDKEAIQVCIRTCNEINKKAPRIIRISNSLDVEHIWLSEEYYVEAKMNPMLEIKSEPEYFVFDEEGNLF